MKVFLFVCLAVKALVSTHPTISEQATSTKHRIADAYLCRLEKGEPSNGLKAFCRVEEDTLVMGQPVIEKLNTCVVASQEDVTACPPGSHPEGYDCGLIGARGKGVSVARPRLSLPPGVVSSLYRW